jgi:hypothetical protein
VFRFYGGNYRLGFTVHLEGLGKGDPSSTVKPNLAKNLALLHPSGCDGDSKYSTIFLRSTRTRFAHGKFIFLKSAWQRGPIGSIHRSALYTTADLAKSKETHAVHIEQNDISTVIEAQGRTYCPLSFESGIVAP